MTPEAGEPAGVPTRLRHASLETGDLEVTALELLETTDRHRLGLLLQGCALLAHLERAGLRLERGWDGAGVCAAGTLRVEGVTGGRSRELPQALLRELALRLFRAGERVAGRGEARRIARRLLEEWQQDIEPISLENAIDTLLREAPFLFEPPYAAHRRALAAEAIAEAESVVWLAGPAALRRRLVGARFALEEAWRSLEDGDWAQLLEEERNEDAASARPVPAGKRRRYELARAELDRGRFLRALDAVRDQASVEARLLRLECQVRLGRLQAAKRTLQQLLASELRAEEILAAAELAIRVHGNLGERDHARDWVARALDAGRGALRARALVIAALADWDRSDPSAMARHLEEAQRCGIAGIERAYHHASGLHAVLEERPELAAQRIAQALSTERRRLGRHAAARLWNDLVLARVLAGDLAGAERACRHCLRLFAGSDGPVTTTLALYNLAEVRVRRGRLAGVEDILERCRTENARSANVRGAAQDAELWARLDLARGRPEQAYARCSAALEQLRADGVEWCRAELELLASRALGWLGRAAEASELIAGGVSSRLLAMLEPEERPALFALAGRLAEAREAASHTAAGPLFRAAWAGTEPSPDDWEVVDRLEPYRGARLVFDLHLLAPERVPRARRNWASVVLRRAGADGLAVRLEPPSDDIWPALRDWLAAPPNANEQLVARVFETAGHPRARLEVCRLGGATPEVVLEGSGGPEHVEHEGSGGRWRLQVSRRDAAAEALVRLADRLAAPAASRAPRAVPAPSAPPKRKGLVGESPVFQQALERIEKLARLDLPVLVLGETGTGKELAARHLHACSPRKDRTFLAINCAALSETLVLSDLFGHARGAFTGADRERAGVFEAAEGGTVLLDEIGDLPLPAQGMLLRVLQEGEVRRLGETRARRVDVRVVAATHRDLERMVLDERFREDLYYRLRVGTVTLPPLRERGADVVLLAESILEELGDIRASRDAKTALRGCPWPGNVRQLRAVLEAASALVDPAAGILEPEHLDLPDPASDRRPPWHEWLEQLKRERVRSELDACGGNQAEAARRLGLTRQALSYLVRQLDPAKRRRTPGDSR